MRDIDQLLSAMEDGQPAPEDFDAMDFDMASEWLVLADSIQADKPEIRRQIPVPASQKPRRTWLWYMGGIAASFICAIAIFLAYTAEHMEEQRSMSHLTLYTADGEMMAFDMGPGENPYSADEAQRGQRGMQGGAPIGIQARPTATIPAPRSTVIASDYQSQLEAGEINDNDDFAAYRQYRLDYLRFVGANDVHDIDVSERHTIQVTTPNGDPVLGAEVVIFDSDEDSVATLQTTASGTVHFYPFAYSNDGGEFLVQVSKNGTTTTFDMTRDNRDARWDVELDVPAAQPPIKLDVLFLIDSTGSMKDEINELKENMLSISSQIDELPAEPDVRYGLVTYRDRRDEYITRVYDFTSNVNDFQATLLALQANGGGDYPESVNQGLYEAIHEVEWREDETVKIMILVGDAPPHLDYAQDFDYAEEVLNAAERGIKIHVVASSGLDETGEYIFRQIAQITGGNFIFLTYEDTPQSATSNEPGEPGTDHHVPEAAYTVEYLDALVVRLIEAELMLLMEQQNLQQ